MLNLGYRFTKVTKCALTICKQFNLDMKVAGYKETSQIQFEGYLNAYIFHTAVNKCKADLTNLLFAKVT